MCNEERFLREETPPYSPHLVSGSSKKAEGKCPSGLHKTERERTGKDGDTDLEMIYVKRVPEAMKFHDLTTKI